MRRTTLLTIALVVASVAAIPVVGMAAAGGDVVAQTDNTTGTDNATDANGTVAPGERLSGVVGAQGAELEGEVDSRAFGLQVAKAATDNAKADVVAEKFGELEQRLEELEQRKAELDEARENGSMSEGKYRARVTELAAQTETVQRLANQTNETAGELPTELLDSRGLNATAIQTLKTNAGNLSGQEVAEIARSIAGQGVGKAPGTAPGDTPGERPDDAPGERPDDSDESTDTPTETDAGSDDRTDRGSGSENGNGGQANGGQAGQSGGNDR